MNTVQELMSRDPLECSDQDIELIIKDLREKLKHFEQGNLAAGKMKLTKRTSKEEVAVKAAGKIDLKSLGL